MRLGHGDPIGLVHRASSHAFSLRIKTVAEISENEFGYMFSAMPDQRPADGDRLPESADMLAALDALGVAMAAADPGEVDATLDRATPGSGKVPAGFTYFGQFIDRDITVAIEPLVAGKDMIFGDFVPLLSLDDVRNGRTPRLELDSVYGPSGAPDTQVPDPVDGRMVLHDVSIAGADQTSKPFLFVPNKGSRNDLPRKGRSTDPRIDREALIGDPRNDENLIVAQLHVAFLKAHNSLIDQGKSFDEAREQIILRYQAAIIDDYLPRICDGPTLDAVLANGPRFLDSAGPLFMPIEFAAAGFRFGHSMVRSAHDFNLNFDPAATGFAFTFTALQGNLSPFPGAPANLETDHFPHNWIVEWQRFLEIDPAHPPQAARPIDAHLTPILAGLRDTFGAVEQGIAAHLARRNLRRGYLFGLPTGQAVATKVGVAPIVISAETTGLDAAAVAPFTRQTPLWLYVLAEAGMNQGKLGVVGTTILAETFVSLIRRSDPSIFDGNGHRVTADRHSLTEIIDLAGLQDAAPAAVAGE